MRLGAALATVALLAAVTAGCADTGARGGGSPPDREPDVSGVVAGTGEPGGAVLAEPSDAYYEGMGLLRGDPLIVKGDDAQPVSPAELEDGQRVDVWTDGVCAESFPVQCGITALRLQD
jgi:hypothetical protein